ncbi:MAG: protein kinase, partial [Chloroflexota bacterium]
MSKVQRRVGKYYALGRVIGQGGMGTVHIGMDMRTRKKVAIKAVKKDMFSADPNMAERFQREADALRKLNHPNIVKMFDWIEEGDETFIVMELVGGGDLRSLIQAEEQLSVDRVLNIALDLSDALARAHRLNIIHRDIKPANVMLAQDGTPRLTDFGIAKMTDRTAMTETGSIVGTYAYISPEQCMGEAPSPRSDVWAFGVMLYEMLTGTRPYAADNPVALLRAILADPVPPITTHRNDLPPALVTLVHAMLEKDPNQRVSSMRLIGSQIEAIMEGTPTPIQPARTQTATGEILVDFGTPEPAPLSELQRVLSTPTGSAIRGTAASAAPGSTAPPTTEQKQPSFLRRVSVRVAFGALLLVGIAVVLMVLDFGSQVREATENLPGGVVVPEADTHNVLVAQFEQLGDAQPREVQRFVAEDLREKFEETIPFSDIEIVTTDTVVRNDDEALRAAEQAGAIVVIWGSYDDRDIFVNVDAGTLEPAGGSPLERDMLTDLTNIRLTMDDPIRQSLAYNVMAVTNLVFTATDRPLDVSRTIAVVDALGDINAVPVEGDGVPASFHRYIRAYLVNDMLALRNINAVVDLTGNNPYALLARSLTHDRMGNTADALEDIQVARTRTDDVVWGMADFTEAVHYLFIENDPASALAPLERNLEGDPDDWLTLTMIGAVYHLDREYDLAYDFYQDAIANSPTASYPYVLIAPIALRRGELRLTQDYTDIILNNYPDPVEAIRIVTSQYGDSVNSGLPHVVAAYGHAVLGRHEEAIAEANQARRYRNFATLPDLYVLLGFSRCNLSEFEAAIQAYSNGLELENDIAVLHLLRAESRFRLAITLGPLRRTAL